MVAKLPKGKGKGVTNDQLTQEEFMALLESGSSGFDENGNWRLVKEPFSGEETKAADASGEGKSLFFQYLLHEIDNYSRGRKQ